MRGNPSGGFWTMLAPPSSSGARRQSYPSQCAPGPAHARALDGSRLDVIYIDDRGWPWARRIRPLWGAQLGLAEVLGGDTVGDSRDRRDHAPADIGHPEAGKADALVALA